MKKTYGSACSKKHNRNINDRDIIVIAMTKSSSKRSQQKNLINSNLKRRVVERKEKSNHVIFFRPDPFPKKQQK